MRVLTNAIDIPVRVVEGNTVTGVRPSNAYVRSVKRILKTWLGFFCYHSGLFRLFWSGKALVVAFHRIDDRYPDNPLTCSVAAFEAYCRFFRRFFIVVPLKEFLAKLEAGADISRHLVITFDDGYRDNFAVAAPVLKDLGLPACFFVTTGFVGSSRIPWWDKQKGIESEWMAWDDVRALVRDGFEIGAHTVNHVDMARVSHEEARAELEGSRAKLRTELGVSIDLFAYPYGRVEQMTEEVREISKHAGFVCCLSCHGGVVTKGSSGFRLMRTPVSPWFRSPHQFGFETMYATEGRR